MNMRYIILIVIALCNSTTFSNAQSNLLENVKRNPAEAISLCSTFRELNSKGVSASSKESIIAISKKRNLNNIDAEILSMYVRGMHCPDVI